MTIKRLSAWQAVRVAVLVTVLVYTLLWCSVGSFAQEYREYGAAVAEAIAKKDIQYKSRKWVEGTSTYEMQYYNGLKKLGFEKFSLRIIWKWYPDGDTSKVQQEWHMVVHLDKGQAFWLMNQIAQHFEGVSKQVEENYCPECIVRGRRTP